MAITQSAKKAIRNSARKHEFNLVRKDAMNKLLKKARKLISEKKIAEAEKMIPEVYQAIDKAVKTNFLKKNTASRKKSRLIAALRKTA